MACACLSQSPVNACAATSALPWRTGSAPPDAVRCFHKLPPALLTSPHSELAGGVRGLCIMRLLARRIMHLNPLRSRARLRVCGGTVAAAAYARSIDECCSRLVSLPVPGVNVASRASNSISVF